MKRISRVVLSALALTLAISTASTAAQAASPDSVQACPTPGERVKKSGAEVYPVEPTVFIDLIPTPTDYFNLWDSWDEITTISDAPHR